MFGAANLGDGGHDRPESVAAMATRPRSAAATASARARSCKAISDKKPVHARRRARPHQGLVLLRLMHRTGGAGARVHAGRRLFDGAEGQAGVQVHRPQPRRRPPRHRRAGAEDASPTSCRFMDWTTPNGCHSCRPALNYYLLCDLARRIPRRPAVALHQRPRARQHPEGRHVLRRAADVGRRHHAERAARHRRRRRQVRHADGQGHRRPAHRPARREEGGPAGGLGRPQRCRHGVRPRLRQGRCAR